MKNEKNNNMGEKLNGKLYLEISTDKNQVIASIRDEIDEQVGIISNETEVLQGFKQKRKSIIGNIKDVKKELFQARVKKFKLTRELSREIDLQSKLSNEYEKDESFIDISTYHEEEDSKEIELTDELYRELSEEITSDIISIKAEKRKILQDIKDLLQILNELVAERKQKESDIKCSKKTLNRAKSEKFKLSRQLSVQNKLLIKLVNLMKKTDISVNRDDFYPENKTKRA